MRECEPHISTLNSTGIPAPLGSYHRKPKQVTKQLIIDDGFRVINTTNQQLMQNPKVHVTQPKFVIGMVNKSNMDDVPSLNDRTVGGPREGFGSLLPNHNRQHERRYFSTENRDFFGAPKPQSESQSLLQSAARMRMAGTTARPFDQQSTKVISNLMGEKLDHEADPQERVDIQRQWLAQTDIAIHQVNNGKARLTQTNMFDNSNSLPLGEGMQLAFMRPNPNGAYFGRKGQDVTQVPNQVITRK